MNLRRRVALAILLAGVAVVAVAAVPRDSATPAVNQADRLIVAVSGDPPGLDPAVTYIFGWEFAQNLYSRPFTHKVNYGKETSIDALAPDVVQSWTVAPNKKSVIFRLNPRATFANGTPVTSEDFHYSFKRGIQGKLGYTTAQYFISDLTSIKQVKILGRHRIRLNFPKGMNRFALQNIATESFAIYSKRYMEAHSSRSDPWGSKYLNKHPMGSGPYVLESWKPGQELVLKARGNYWGNPKPVYKEIRYRIVPDAQTRALLLRSGAVDVAYELSPVQYRQLGADPKLRVVSVPTAQDVLAFRMNPSVQPFDDVNLRRAIIKAIPYDTILKSASYGFATRVQSPCGVTAYGYKRYPLYTTNLSEARQLVEKSKYADGGASFTLVVPTGYPERVAAAVFMQSNLKSIGVDMQIQKLPTTAYQDNAFKGKYRVNMHTMGPWFNDCLYWAYWMFHSKSPTNYIRYKNGGVDQATLKALSLPAGDNRTYNTLLTTVVERELVGNAIMAPIYQANWTIAAKKEVKRLIYWPWLAVEWKYARPAK